MAELEALLAAGTKGTALGFERAQLLDGLGCTQEAQSAYLDVLSRDSKHTGALNELGRLLDRTGFRTAARTAFTRAVDTHPDDPLGHGNLATSLLDMGDTAAARRHYEIAVRLDPDNIVAHQCLAIILLREGDAPGAAAHARIGFRHGASCWPYRGRATPIPVLVVHSALGGNIPIDRFIDDATFVKSTIVAEFFPPTHALPPHALVVNAIGDAGRCGGALRAATALLSATSAPIVNAPARISATAREATAPALAHLPGVIAPLTVPFTRSQLRGSGAAARLAAANFDWPVIVRSAGFHTGKHCVLVTQPAQLEAAVASLPGDDLLGIEFTDVRSISDAMVRKYRVMIVDGAVLPLHLAISTHWMVHYFSADMANADHRAEEAAFLAHMPSVLGPDAADALSAIASRIGLDYGGIDFALDAQRRIVVFEANATMIVPPSAAELQPYRRKALERIENAVRSMLLARAGLVARAKSSAAAGLEAN